METLTDRAGRPVDMELELVREAIAMVAGGGSRRVVVAGLRFGASIIERARLLAASSGVSVVLLQTPDNAGPDIAVERASVA
jgi:hypothetical protein